MKNEIESQLIVRETGKLILPQHYVDKLEKLGTPVSLEKNQVLCRAGDIPDSCYYICRGRIAAYEYTTSGSEHVFSVSYRGELILVPSMVVTHPLLFNFKAVMPTELVRIRRETVYQAIAEDADVSTALIYSLSMRFITTVEQSRQLDSRSVPWRVCNLLLSMAEYRGADYDGKVLIQEKVSQQTMASNLHANRVTVARAIRDLKECGLVEYINGHYCIRSIDKLKKHMDYLETMPGNE